MIATIPMFIAVVFLIGLDVAALQRMWDRGSKHTPFDALCNWKSSCFWEDVRIAARSDSNLSSYLTLRKWAKRAVIASVLGVVAIAMFG